MAEASVSSLDFLAHTLVLDICARDEDGEMHNQTVNSGRRPDVFHILADPTKRKILDLVRDREWSVGELVNYFGLPQPAVSKHLRALREANMVDVRVDGQRRWYRLKADSLQAVGNWIEPYRALWAAQGRSNETSPGSGTAESGDKTGHHAD